MGEGAEARRVSSGGEGESDAKRRTGAARGAIYAPALNGDVLDRIAQLSGWSRPCASVSEAAALLRTGLFQSLRLRVQPTAPGASVAALWRDSRVRGLWIEGLGAAELTLVLGELLERARGARAERGSRAPLRLGLEHCPLDLAAVCGALHDVVRCDALAELLLDGNALGDEGAQALSRALALDDEQVLGLQSLSVRANQLSGAGCAALAQAMGQGRGAPLRVLDLSYNRIAERGAQAVARLLRTRSSHLTVLDLSYCKIGPGGAAALAGALSRMREPGHGLVSLACGFNELGDAGAGALAAALWRNASLTALGLQENRISSTGAAALLAALAHQRRHHERPCQLQTLSLACNSLRGGSGAQGLALALETAVAHSPLRSVDLSACQLGPAAAQAILRGLAHDSSRLAALVLVHNQIGPQAAVALQAAAGSHPLRIELDHIADCRRSGGGDGGSSKNGSSVGRDVFSRHTGLVA
jgi:Ran GTPase-activating protein (RanGAP) involved in mRNA processing and transport